MTSFTADDHRYMARAIKLAAKPVFSPHPNPRVGCVIVNNGKIVGEGFHEFAGGPHAEVNALQLAGNEAKQSTVYVTLEPCSHFGRTPPCADALLKAQVAEVIVAMKDPNPKVAGKGLEKLKQAGIKISFGLLAQQAKELNKGFIKRMLHNMPWVCSKIAMSIDGRTSMSSGESKWITGSQARKDVQVLRARTHAILTGSGTVLADDPQLTVREFAKSTPGFRQPVRIVVDGQKKLPATAKIFQETGETILAVKAAGDLNCTYIEVKSDSEKIDLSLLLKELAKKEINEVLVEAGPGLNGALLSQGLIDELIVYMATDVMGDDANGMFHLPQLKSMQQKIPLTCKDVRKIGNNIRFKLTPGLES